MRLSRESSTGSPASLKIAGEKAGKEVWLAFAEIRQWGWSEELHRQTKAYVVRTFCWCQRGKNWIFSSARPDVGQKGKENDEA